MFKPHDSNRCHKLLRLYTFILPLAKGLQCIFSCILQCVNTDSVIDRKLSHVIITLTSCFSSNTFFPTNAATVDNTATVDNSTTVGGYLQVNVIQQVDESRQIDESREVDENVRESRA